MSINLKKYIKSNWRIIILIILSVVFFVLYSWYPYQAAKDTDYKFASPDETANYFWAKRFSELSLRGSASDRSNHAANEKNGEIATLPSVARNDSALFYFEPLNLAARDVVVPRSVRSDSGMVKPVSFLGIILIYGTLAKIFGPGIIIYLTPLLAAIGVLFFYGIIKKIFDEKIALFSAVMMFALAPYWYYASRSMFHNVLFVDLLLVGVYFLINGTRIERMKRLPVGKAGIRTDFIFIFLSGIFFGLATVTRASELIWLLPAMLIIWLSYFKQIGWRKLIIFICGIFLALAPMFYYNHSLYGSVFNFGYSTKENIFLSSPFLEEGKGVVVSKNNASEINFETKTVLDKMTKFILPFGFHPRAVWQNFVNYYIVLFWYLFWPTLLGGILYLWQWRQKDKRQKLYFFVFVFTGVILSIYYGSWVIQDSIKLGVDTIGTSYARYFLPMYIMSLPLVAMFLIWCMSMVSFPRKRESSKFISEIPAFAGMTVFVAAFVALNFQTAVFGAEDGLNYTAKNLAQDKARVAQILNLIEPNAIIATKHLDKMFWPKRKVISTNLSDRIKNQAIAVLLQNNIPVYYYGFIIQSGDFAYLNMKLRDYGFELEIINLNEEAKLGLYKLVYKVESL
jgi:4-amino-4-deoxy-L-arabinose transferase-like glycosyltransferase